MKFTSLIKKTVLAAVAVTLVSSFALAAHSSAIPYDPATVGTTYPAFNVYSGVPEEGDEADFLRGKQEGVAGASTTNVSSACNSGTRFVLRVYVHNSGNQSLNEEGNGPVVAKETKVRVALPGQSTASKFDFNAAISARNASTVGDSMSIDCGGKTVELKYVAGSAKQFTGYTGTQALSDDIVTTGALVGTKQPNGDVWGCFGQRVWVTLVVEVKEKQVPPATAQCSLFQIAVVDGRRIRVSNFDYSVQNGAAIKNVTINWGDGSTETVNPGEVKGKEHTYTKDGTYNVTTKVTFTVPGKEDIVSEVAACAQQVQFAPGKPPVVTPPTTTAGVTQQRPTTLVNTGAGSIIGLFAAATIAGTIGYRRFLSRQLGLDS